MTPDEQRAILNDLNLLAVQDINQFWRDASMLQLDSTQFRTVITDGVPEIIDPYAASAGDLAATWYEDAAPDLAYRAIPAALAPVEQLAASTSWALYATGEAALTRMAGFTSRTIFDSARRTTVENAEAEPGATWARHASPGACSFCRMLATRADVYASKAAATTVIGRKGRTRGTQSLGDRYHDHCRCTAVSVRPGQVYVPPDYAADWEKQYTAAVQATADGGPINVNAVLAKMDELEHGPNRATAAKAASANVNDTAAWLAAEAKYNDDVRAWLAAEDAYVPPTPTTTIRRLTEDDGRDLGRDVWHDYARSLDKAAAEPVRVYTAQGFQTTNAGLRNGIEFGDTTVGTLRATDAIRGLDTAIENAPRTPIAMTVARDVDATVYGLGGGSTDVGSLVGRRFRDNAHLSTALQSELTLPLDRHLVELRLDLPANTKALYVSSSKSNERGLATYGPEENELILGRGIDYEIYGSKIEDRGRRVLLARLIGQDATLTEVR